jgi:uncharacterized BrkB/YihY/UPF0761 family membrane protein
MTKPAEPVEPAAPVDSAAPVEGAGPPAKVGRIARLKAERERLTTRALEERDKLSKRRSASEGIDTIFSMFERDSLAGGPVLAGAVAFRIFLFQVPYVFVVVTAFGLTADASGESPSSAARKAGIGGLTAQAIKDVSNMSTWSRITAVAVGTFALFLAARSAVKVLHIVHGLIWEVPMRKPKSLTRAAVIFIGIVTLALALAELIEWVRGRSFLAGIAGIVFFVVVPTAAWLLIAWFLPHDKRCPLWNLLPGALLFGVGVEALHVFTIYWIAHTVATKSDTYGAIGSALALLFWAYLLGRLIVAATTLNAGRWHAYVRRHPELAEGGGTTSATDVTSRDSYLAQAFDTAPGEPTEPTPADDPE